MAKLKNKDLISIHDLSISEIQLILDLAKELKSGTKKETLKGKTLAMIFEKPSTRTRVSFEVGMWQLGGYAIYLAPEDIQLGKRESIKDVARTLSQYVDGIMIRTFFHNNVLQLAQNASIPVINGLSDLLHPCQVLSDLFTVLEKNGKLKGVQLTYIGDGNNVCHSLLYGAAKVGMNLTVITPRGYEPKKEIVNKALEEANESGSQIRLDYEPQAGAKGAEVIYTDVWTSMGQEAEGAKRKRAFQGYQVNEKLLSLAKKDVIVMHCLPAHRGEEITDEVMDGPHSVVFDQAENRLHVQKAIMSLLMG